MKKVFIIIISLSCITFCYWYFYANTYSKGQRFIGNWKMMVSFSSPNEPKFAIIKDGDNYLLNGNNLSRMGLSKESYRFKLKGATLISTDDTERIKYVKYREESDGHLSWQNIDWVKVAEK